MMAADRRSHAANSRARIRGLGADTRAPDVLLSADDGWTARTRDGSRSAHFEVCVAITEDGPQVLGEPVETDPASVLRSGSGKG